MYVFNFSKERIAEKIHQQCRFLTLEPPHDSVQFMYALGVGEHTLAGLLYY